MSDTTQVAVEEVKVKVEAVAAKAVEAVVPDALKAQLETIVKDVVKSAIKELMEELKKPAVVTSVVAALDKNGDGVVTPDEVKEAVVAKVKSWGCCCR
jgi:predicted dinucleotide-utilizing enzyme